MDNYVYNNRIELVLLELLASVLEILLLLAGTRNLLVDETPAGRRNDTS